MEYEKMGDGVIVVRFEIGDVHETLHMIGAMDEESRRVCLPESYKADLGKKLVSVCEKVIERHNASIVGDVS